MRRGRAALPAIALAFALTGCASPDPHAELARDLLESYEPLAACVSAGLADRSDFDGNLGEFVVNRGLDMQLQAIASRYLADGEDLSMLDHPQRVALVERTMRALARYTAEPAQGVEQVRRAMALVEAMSLTAFATGVDCAPSEALQQAMTRAEQALPPAGGAPAAP